MLKQLGNWLRNLSPVHRAIASSVRGYADGKQGRPCAHPRNAEYDEAWLRGAHDRAKARGIQPALDPKFIDLDSRRLAEKFFEPSCAGNVCPVSEAEKAQL